MSESNNDKKLEALEKELAAKKAAESKPTAAQKSETEAEKKPVVKEATTSKPTNPKYAESKPAKSGGFSAILSWLNLILIIALGAGVGYWAWQYHLKLEQKFAQSSQSLTATEQKFTALQNTIKALQSQVQQQQVSAKQLQDSLTSQLSAAKQQLLQVAGRRSQDWILAEADYLVQMAGRKLWLDKDIDTAIAMLKAADQRLADLKDASLLPVRQLISNDITTLDNLERVSQPEIALQINSIIQQIGQLPLNTVQLPDPVDMQIDTELSDSVSDWRSNLYKVWRGLVDDFITVRRRASDTEALIEPKQEWYLRENLKNQLLQSQLALLREQQELYTTTLMQSADWLAEYFDQESASVKQTSTAILQLAEKSVEPKYPSTLSSINGLASAMQQRLDTLYQAEEQ